MGCGGWLVFWGWVEYNQLGVLGLGVGASVEMNYFINRFDVEIKAVESSFVILLQTKIFI